ncbi:unnamed protein product [Rotaria magnacalcarata]|uniref:Uncharacterized protein n=2 Tax=Rotaria magnacalcarata TaxID=392030 RepID=A0A816PK73_9BILA|nr:unnamed protein product [Rotaria magnacalcarata]
MNYQQMAVTRVIAVIIICLGFSTNNHCLSMVIPSATTITDDDISNITTASTVTITFPTTTTIDTTEINRTVPPTSTPILHVRIRVQNSLIETFATEKQLDLLEIQLKQRHIPYRQVKYSKDGKTIIIGPFQKLNNLTATMMIFNHTRFHRNFTKMIPVKSSIIDKKNETNITILSDEIKAEAEHFPLNLEVHEHHHAHDQESYEFRKCLDVCKIYQDNELKPDHNCIRKKCLKEITGI